MTRKSTVMKECNCVHHEGDRTVSLSDFYRNRTRPDGHNEICKYCQKKVNEINKEKKED